MDCIDLSENLREYCEGAGDEEQEPSSKGQAMRLQFIQHPQDESADAAVHLNLAPSYVTYNPVAVQRVMEFFKTEEVSIRSLLAPFPSTMFLSWLLMRICRGKSRQR